MMAAVHPLLSGGNLEDGEHPLLRRGRGDRREPSPAGWELCLKSVTGLPRGSKLTHPLRECRPTPTMVVLPRRAALGQFSRLGSGGSTGAARRSYTFSASLKNAAARWSRVRREERDFFGETAGTPSAILSSRGRGRNSARHIDEAYAERGGGGRSTSFAPSSPSLSPNRRR